MLIECLRLALWGSIMTTTTIATKCLVAPPWGSKEVKCLILGRWKHFPDVGHHTHTNSAVQIQQHVRVQNYIIHVDKWYFGTCRAPGRAYQGYLFKLRGHLCLYCQQIAPRFEWNWAETSSGPFGLVLLCIRVPLLCWHMSKWTEEEGKNPVVSEQHIKCESSLKECFNINCALKSLDDSQLSVSGFLPCGNYV